MDVIREFENAVQAALATPVEEIRSAVLYHKPRSVVAPDYAWRVVDSWIDFPWSALPPVGRTVEAP